MEVKSDWAIFLPSISSLYTKLISKGDASLRNGVIPHGLKSVQDLDFLKDDPNTLFYYPYCLYSAGHAFLDPTKSDIHESMIQKRDKNSIVIGDSGGFQISTGVLDVDWDDPVAIQDIREKILRWLEHTADWSMILDVPIKAIDNPKATKVNSFEDCLNFTIENIEYFIRNRKPGATNFMNVMQGIDPKHNKHWYESVKHFNNPNTIMEFENEHGEMVKEPLGNRALEGWSFGGTCAGNLWTTFQRILEIRDDTNFENCNWLHFLGIGKLWLAPVYNTMQRVIREKYNPNFTISYDAASPYVCVAHGRIYDGFILEGWKKEREATIKDTMGRCSLPLENFVDSKDFIGYNEPWPVEHNSPVADKLLVSDICMNGKEGVNSSWDGYSYGMLMGHNTYVLVHGIQTINRMHDAYRKARQDRDDALIILSNLNFTIDNSTRKKMEDKRDAAIKALKKDENDSQAMVNKTAALAGIKYYHAERMMERLGGRISPNIIKMCDLVEEMFELKTNKERVEFFTSNEPILTQFTMSPTKNYMKGAVGGSGLFEAQTETINLNAYVDFEEKDAVEVKELQDVLNKTGEKDLLATD